MILFSGLIRPFALTILFFLLFHTTSLVNAQEHGAIPEDYNCITCHLDMEDEVITPPVNEWKKSVHKEAGVMCADCHGGDPGDEDMAMDPDAGFVGKPDRKGTAKFCSKCHSDTKLMRQYNKRSDQYLLYSGSVHGKKSAKGDEEVATCTDCHGKHDTLRVKDPNSKVNRKNVIETCGGCHSKEEIFKKRRKPSNQLALYKKSRHHELLSKGDLLAPTCVDCHGNHGVFPVRSQRVQTTCFKCHASQAEYYKASPHWEAFKKDGEPICLSCHNNHDVETPSVSKFSGDNDTDCIGCHEKGSKAHNTGLALQEAAQSVVTAHEDATKNLERLESDGHGGFETSSLFEKMEKNGERMQSLHTLTHRLDVESVIKESEKLISVAQEVDTQVDEFWAEIKTRKIGLMFAWILFLGLGVSLWRWSRSVEQDRMRDDR